MYEKRGLVLVVVALGAFCIPWLAKADSVSDFEEALTNYKEFIEYISKNKNVTSPAFRSLVEIKLQKLKNLAGNIETAAINKGNAEIKLRQSVMALESAYNAELSRVSRGNDSAKSTKPVVEVKRKAVNTHISKRAECQGWSAKFTDEHLTACDDAAMAIGRMKGWLADNGVKVVEDSEEVSKRSRSTADTIQRGGG